MELLTLKELSEKLGVSRRAIQGYETAGLIHSVNRNKYGHLLYDDNSVKRGEMVHFLQDAGFSIKEIITLIDAPREKLIEALRLRLPELELQLKKLDETIVRVRSVIEKG